MEARGWIASADKVLYCVADAATERLILSLNNDSESLYVYYGEGKPRKDTYQEMVERILELVRAGNLVCVAYYGHPGIFVNPSHKAIKIAREEGFVARMLPAVSSLDCMFCDLGFDPSTGCQIIEATDLLLRERQIDASSHVVIWQVAAVGDLAFSFKGYNYKHVPRLVEYLLTFYPSDHEVTVYEAAQFVVCEPGIHRMQLGDLRSHRITGISTLYVPPVEKRPVRISVLETMGLSHVLEGVHLVPIEHKPYDKRRE
jgi:uncharacterized protein YabN with tetrapyrrole methylase and pyrophosphatase domain